MDWSGIPEEFWTLRDWSVLRSSENRHQNATSSGRGGDREFPINPAEAIFRGEANGEVTSIEDLVDEYGHLLRKMPSAQICAQAVEGARLEIDSARAC